jgi:hypothetical protein
MSNELTYESVLELIKETNKMLSEKFQDSEKRFKESERMLTEKFQETDKKFKETDKMLSEKFKETDKMLSEKFRETDKMLSEKFRETEKMISDMGKGVGGLGKAIGNITEGLTFPSIAQELIDKFNVELISENVAKRKKNKHLELDVFGYSNSVKNEAYIVEIKSTLQLDAIEQIEKTMLNFRELMPEHAEKKLYGIISAIKAPKNLIEEVNKHGFYFATVKDGFFKVEFPKGFKPKVF